MKKAMIALSAILVAAPVFAATTTHATDDTVAAAHEGAIARVAMLGSLAWLVAPLIKSFGSATIAARLLLTEQP